MSVLSGYDRTTPPAHPPATDVVWIYAGGDTPHVWTPEEIGRQTARYRLPVWVRSNPSPEMATPDSHAFSMWLGEADGFLHQSPPIAVLLDLETAATPAYVEAFARLLPFAAVLPYGSSSTLQKNPRCAGYVVDLPGASGIPPWAEGVQYGQETCSTGLVVDRSWLRPSLAKLLWDTRPDPPTDEETPMLKPGLAHTATTNVTWLIYLDPARGLVKQGIIQMADYEALQAQGAVVVSYSPEGLAAIPTVELPTTAPANV